MTVATAPGIQFLNLAYFGRPADPASLSAWPASGLSLEAIVLQFTGTAEYATNTVQPNSAVNPGGGRTFNDTNLINTFYQRLFGRLATSAEVAGWADALARGAVNYDYLGITILQAGLNLPAGTEMRQVLIAKFDSNQLYTGILFNNPVSAAAYSTAAAILDGITFSSATTTTTPQTVAQAQTAVNQMVSDSGAGGGQTFTLTTGGDTIPGMIGSNGTSSTAGNDTINSVLAGGNSTLNIFDSIDAGTGVNTINVNLANTDPGALGFGNMARLTNVQRVNFQSYDFDGGVAFDASVAPQITTLGLVRQLGDGNFTTNNALGTLNAFVINNLQLDDTDIDVNYTSGQLAGAADTVAVELTDVKAATVDETNSTEISLDGGAAGQGIETVNLTVTSESRLGDLLVRDSAGTSTITTLNVAGAGSLRIFDALDFKDTAGSINTSSSTGEVWLRVGTETITYTGGSGNDRLDFEAVGDFNNSDVINFGGGTNTIGLDDITYSNELYGLINGVSTAQRLALLDGDGATIDMSKLTLNTIVISNAASNADKGDNIITKLTSSDTVIIEAGFANVDVNLDGSLGFNTANIVLAGTSTASVSVDNLDLLNQATINITSNGSNAAAANTVTDLNNTAGSVITVTGSQAVTFTDALTAAAVVNASVATGALTVTGANAASSITGGSADDVISLGTLAGGDTVVGGAGADTINTVDNITGTTATVITAGLGADTVNVNDAAAAIAKITYNATAAESYASAGQSDLLAYADAAATDDMIVTFVTGKTSASLTTATNAAFVLGTTTVNAAGGFLWVNASGVATVEDENAVLYQDTNDNGVIDSTDFAARLTRAGATDTFALSITGGQAVVTFEGN